LFGCPESCDLRLLRWADGPGKGAFEMPT
jgi:hypothetical protein